MRVRVKVGLSGALLAELALLGAIDVRDSHVEAARRGRAEAAREEAGQVARGASGGGCRTSSPTRGCWLLERVAPERSDHKRAKARIAEATDQALFAPEVLKVIDELIAAVAMVAVVASTAAASGGS